MPISEKDVRHVLALARLRVPDPEVHRLVTDLESILGHVAALQQADVAGVAPMTHAVPATLPLRPDERVASLGPGGLAGSAGRQDRFVKVPKIVE